MTNRILHIHGGFPKTGSSALQLFLMQNRGKLADSGIFLPTVGQRKDGPHHALLMKLAGLSGWGRKQRLLQVIDEIDQSQADQVLLSSEYLVALIRSSLLGFSLRQFRWRGFDIRFHIFVRPQTDLINSGYAEFLRSTLVFKSFDDFLAERVRSRRSSYTRILRRLQWYTREDINLIPYSDAIRNDGVYWPFLDGLGVPVADRSAWSVPGVVNPTLGPIGVHVVGRVLKRIEKRGLIRGFRNRKMLRDRLWQATQRFPAEDRAFCGLDNAMRDTLWAKYAEQNDAMAEQYWGRRWDDVFSVEKARHFEPNLYRHRTANAEVAARYDEMMDLAWRATRRARRRYEERAAARQFRDRLLDPFDRVLDISVRMGLTLG